MSKISCFILHAYFWWCEKVKDAKERVNALRGTDLKRKAQKWFLFRFTGKDEEVNLLGDGTERPEFSEWSWMTPQQLLDLVVSYKKPVYEEVLRTFTPHFH
ncbi:hypothetical protein MRB53_016358 [Persea americana]|uniref:Uncharacterized protein n=1 Tax=Persea americana TaxID=3435 RepID=A0ACC2M258_PERAE|nr:hypothetical protein MRB53_016358 [Persea americana]